eukprot:gb/GECH01012553.1/.p1 GENE.gb/GECH01012553.1/~~gb/GECH01012553.1/.p1  ORF type:complete len:279 (+),score=52.92 gb/GECH01012553.1/:1-837(+)
MSSINETEQKVIDILKKADDIVVLTGAGMSAESGIDTFRDPEVGFWKNKIGLALFGTPLGWWMMPGISWNTYITRFRSQIMRANPNPGHEALARLEQHVDSLPHHNFFVLTQNVDGFHQRAGNKNVAELHGTVERHCCYSCHANIDIDEAYFLAYQDPETKKPALPRCSKCGGNPRPDATLFTEGLPNSEWIKARQALSCLKRSDRRGVMLVIGTSGEVFPVAGLPEEAAEAANTTVVEINIQPSKIYERGYIDIFLSGKSGEILPKIVEQISNQQEE